MLHVRFALVGALLFTGAAAQATDREDIWPVYWKTLEQACPAKHLDLLGPADLRAALEDYKAHLSGMKSVRLTHIEHKHCGRDGDPACRNMTDLAIAEDHHMLAPLVQGICDHFALCRGQSDCDVAGTAGR